MKKSLQQNTNISSNKQLYDFKRSNMEKLSVCVYLPFRISAARKRKWKREE